jgi:hypothetical protein
MAGSRHRTAGGLALGLMGFFGRLLLIVAGAVFFVRALTAAVIASVGLLLWSLVTGRRPTLVRFGDGRWVLRSRAAGTAAAGARAKSPGEVIDIEAREVHGADARRD